MGLPVCESVTRLEDDELEELLDDELLLEITLDELEELLVGALDDKELLETALELLDDVLEELAVGAVPLPPPPPPPPQAIKTTVVSNGVSI